MSYRIRLAKENFKFSCSHFTILGPEDAERLHGHNYYVVVEICLTGLDANLGMAFDFNRVKPLIREATQALDEYVLLPARSPYLKLARVATDSGGENIRVSFGGKRYEFPVEDVRILETAVNVTSEELARTIAEELVAKLRKQNDLMPRLGSISVSVEETRGQSVIYDLSCREEQV